MEGPLPSTSSELKNTILRAGAGAGKTTRLVDLFVEYATEFKNNNKTQFPRIVVTTFTRKATQELKERLLDRAMQDNNHELFLYINQKSKVQISTIHGILSLFLSAHGRRIGLTPDYKIQPETEIKKQARRVLRSLILENQNWLDLLEEYSFVEIENVLIRYFNESFSHQNLQPVTSAFFQEKTLLVLQELAVKARKVGSAILADPPTEKWQKWGEGLLRIDECKSVTEIPHYFDRLFSLKEELGSKPPAGKKTNIDPLLNEQLTEIVNTLRELTDEKKNYIYQPTYWEKHDQINQPLSELCLKFREKFLQQKLEKGLLSMSDLESLSLFIINQDPVSAEIFSQDWDFWMIDEYQDTSPVQVQLLKAFIQSRPHFVVGDPQQSIYLFRGARTEVFEEKVLQIQKQSGIIETKMQNHRSRPELLDFFNEYFAADAKFSPMTAAGKGFQMGPQDPVAEVLIIDREKSEEGPSQAEAVIFRIQELLEKGVPAEKICVLARKNKILEQVVHEARRYHLPVQLHSSSGFYQRREVQDALALLKFFANPYDDQNLISILRSPWFYHTDQEIVDLCMTKKSSLWSNLKNEDLKKYFHLAQTKGLSFSLRATLIDRMAFDYSYQMDPSGRREANLWKLISLLSQEERRPGFNVLEFVKNCALELSTDEGGDDADATPVIEPQRVNLMTVHASKGLQFDHVIIPEMQETKRSDRAAFWSLQESTGLWSLSVKNDDSGQAQGSMLAEDVKDEKNEREKSEHRRVLYVALTRARESVTLIWQEKPGTDSWASFFPFTREPGLHQSAKFIYSVRREKGFQPTRQELVHEDKLKVRSALITAKQKTTPHRSVTAMIDIDHAAPASQQTFKPEQMGRVLQRMQRGTDAHRLFESLKYASFAEVKAMTTDPTFKNAIDFIEKSQNVPLAEIIRQGFAEWGFTLKDESFVLQGQIDLWAELKNEIWLIDYKTGTKENSEKAIQQLMIYSWALKKMNFIQDRQPVHLVAVYPIEGQLIVRDYRHYAELAPEVEKMINESSQDL